VCAAVINGIGAYSLIYLFLYFIHSSFFETNCGITLPKYYHYFMKIITIYNNIIGISHTIRITGYGGEKRTFIFHTTVTRETYLRNTIIVENRLDIYISS
jgi:hypothetical protein